MSHSCLAPHSATQAGKQHELVLSERPGQLWKPCVCAGEGITGGDAGGSALCIEQPGLGQLGLISQQLCPWLLAEVWLGHSAPSPISSPAYTRVKEHPFLLLSPPVPIPPPWGTPQGHLSLGKVGSVNRGEGWVPWCIGLPSAARVLQLVWPAQQIVHGIWPCPLWLVGAATVCWEKKQQKRCSARAVPGLPHRDQSWVEDPAIFLEMTEWATRCDKKPASLLWQHTLAGENIDFLIAQVPLR